MLHKKSLPLTNETVITVKPKVTQMCLIYFKNSLDHQALFIQTASMCIVLIMRYYYHFD